MSNIKESLNQELKELKKARDVLQYSYEKCVRIGLKTDFNYEELESFEALTSRFARLSDIIIQKILRFFDTIDLEEAGTVRDRINRAEKKGIIDSADDLIQIRILRNEISHQYESETISNIFEQVMKLSLVLLKSVDNILAYAERYFEPRDKLCE